MSEKVIAEVEQSPEKANEDYWVKQFIANPEDEYSRMISRQKLIDSNLFEDMNEEINTLPEGGVPKLRLDKDALIDGQYDNLFVLDWVRGEILHTVKIMRLVARSGFQTKNLEGVFK